MQRRPKVILPHEQQPGRLGCARCWLDLLPAGAVALVLAAVLLWALAGCAQRQEAGYTTRDELRVACGTAARAYAVAIERTRSGEMSPQAFRAVDDGYAGVVETCRRVLAGGAEPAPGDLAGVAGWTASVPVDRGAVP